MSNFMTKLLNAFSSVVLISSITWIPFASAAPTRKVARPQTRRALAPVQKIDPNRRSPVTPTTIMTPEESKDLSKALDLARTGNYRDASIRLYKMSRDPRFLGQSMQIKYILGLMLYEMKFYQAAAYQFVDVIRVGNNKYIKGSLEKLAIVADVLNDDTLLNYALSRIQLDEFPTKQRDMLLFRIGEYQYRGGAYDKAIASLRTVPKNSTNYSQAKYLEGLALAEKGDLDNALKSFASLVRVRRGTSVTDTNRVSGLMGLARTYYQKQNWEKSIEFYRRIPRDSEFWHDSLFEMSWAQMRSSRFRSVLSNFHSLHSPYYEDFYLPESVLLRSIVYLYICQYNEMDKTVNLFDRVYLPVLRDVANFLRSNRKDSGKYYTDFDNVLKDFDQLKDDPSLRSKYPIPFLVARQIKKEGDVQRNQKYIDRLNQESRNLALEFSSWRSSPIGDFVNRAVHNRLKAARERGGRLVRNHMIQIYKDLRDLAEQNAFAKYEMLNARKEDLKKKIAGKGLISKQVDADNSRTYYIQNGFEYWPFTGEYWLDEIGNYFYLGNHSCD